MGYSEYFEEGKRLMKLREYFEAILYFSKSIELNENIAVIYRNRAAAYYYTNEFEKSIIDLSKSIELDGNNSSAYLNRGVSYKRLNEFNKAILDYTHAIRLNPDDALAYSNRGNCFNSLKQYNNAISDLSKAIEIDHSFATAYNNRGNSYHDLEEYYKAISDYNKAIELNPEFALAYRNRSRSYNNIGNYNRAINDSSKSIELDKSDLEGFVQIGVAYNGLFNFAKAKVEITKAINQGINTPFAFNTRGISNRGLNQQRSAIDDYTIAINLDKNYYIAYSNRGVCYCDLGEYENALSDLNKSIELNKEYYASYFNRSIVYFYKDTTYLKRQSFKVGINYIGSCYRDLLCYLFLIDKCYVYPNNLKFILEVLEEYPQNVQFILDHFEINTELLLFSSIESIIKKNKDVSVFLSLLKKLEWYSDKENLNLEYIFKYHMGGCLTTYEMFSNFDQISTNQEYYYWLLSSYEIQINFKKDFESCIEFMLQNQNTDLDYYYSGLTYLLKEEKGTAIEFFKKSKQFLFSRILLTFFTEDKDEKVKLISQLNQEILEFEFDTFELNKKMSFDAYFHYFECKEYIEELKINEDINLIFDTNFTTFQSIFKLNDAARSELDILDYSLDIKKGIDKMSQEFENQFDPALNLDQTKLELTKTKEKFKDIFNKLERNIGEGMDAENELRTVIESYAVNSIKFYSLLITYYYAQNKIDKKQAFYLTLFLLKIDTDFKDKKLGYAMTETYKTGLDTGKTITGNLALKIVLGLAKSGAPKLFEFLKEEDAFDKSETQYYKFKENIIHYFKMEKANLSSKKFEDKFRLIDYFVDIDGL